MKTSDKDLLRYLALSAFGVAITLGAMRLLGEVHGLTVSVISLLVVTANLSTRLQAVQRELDASRGTSDINTIRRTISETQ